MLDEVVVVGEVQGVVGSQTLSEENITVGYFLEVGEFEEGEGGFEVVDLEDVEGGRDEGGREGVFEAVGGDEGFGGGIVLDWGEY